MPAKENGGRIDPLLFWILPFLPFVRTYTSRRIGERRQCWGRVLQL